MATLKVPSGLSAGGRALWKSIADEHELDPAQRVTLLEACRAKDRLDKLDDVLRGDGHTWMQLVEVFNSEQISELRITQALQQANSTANLMKQLLAAMRLPDSSGQRPQQRGGARGAYAAQAPASAAKVSSIERARARKSG